MARHPDREGDPTTLAGSLRALRDAAGLSQVQAAERTRSGGRRQVSQAQLSRIENGESQPKPAQVAALLDAYEAPPAERRRLTEWVESLATEHVDARVILQAGGAHNFQRRVKQAEENARTIRSYQPTTILGVLQTRAYIEAVFAPDASLSADDAAASVLERLARQGNLADPSRQWHLIQTEWALRSPVHSYRLQAEQVEHIASVSRLPNVRLGIVPADTITGEPGPMTGFHLYDDRHAMVGTDAGTALLSAPSRVETYVEWFGKVETRAVFDDEARALLDRIAAKYRSG